MKTAWLQVNMDVVSMYNQKTLFFFHIKSTLPQIKSFVIHYVTLICSAHFYVEDFGSYDSGEKTFPRASWETLETVMFYLPRFIYSECVRFGGVEFKNKNC